LGRARDTLNVAVKISTESKDRTSAFILLFGEPSAFNDGGGKYQSRSVAGAAYCKGFANNPRDLRRLPQRYVPVPVAATHRNRAGEVHRGAFPVFQW